MMPMTGNNESDDKQPVLDGIENFMPLQILFYKEFAAVFFCFFTDSTDVGWKA